MKYMELNDFKGKSNKKGPKVRKVLKDLKKTTNHINYNFESDKPNLKWYADFTYVKVASK
jgi:hypothetical protein